MLSVAAAAAEVHVALQHGAVNTAARHALEEKEEEGEEQEEQEEEKEETGCVLGVALESKPCACV